MEKFLTFLSSGLFSNILAIISLLVALLPQKDTVSIDNSTNYYFQIIVLAVIRAVIKWVEL